MMDAAHQSEPVSFGGLLRQYRVAAGLSREALAERAGLSARGIQDLERGVNRAPRADTVTLLFEALALAPEERAAFEATIKRHRKPNASATLAEGGNQALPIGRFLGAVPDNRLVGREGDLVELREVVEAVISGVGRLVTLAGEPGVGKTRLAQEVALDLRNRGFLVATGRCYEPQQAVPYYPFLEGLMSAYAAAPYSVRVEAARRWPRLGLLLPDEIHTQETTSSQSRDDQQRLFQAVTGFLVAIAEIKPVALLIDDLHWADSASLDVLQHLARHTRDRSVLLLGTYRDVEIQRQHPLRQALRDLNRERLVQRLAVRRLGKEDTASLIAAALEQAEVSPAFAELMHRHTEGNPFFTDEVLRALIDRGDLYREDGRWTLRAIEKLSVPESVRDAIGERLSHLAQPTQELLRQASVLGQTFAFEALQGTSGRAEEAIEAALEEAMGAGLIREHGRDGYEFGHALIQQTLYQELSSRQRRKVHKAAGEALEHLLQRGDKYPAAELAQHFLEADASEQALCYTLQAGQEAFLLGAWREAERHSRSALQLAREIGAQDREAQALWEIAGSLHHAGRYHEAVEVGNEAMSLVQAGGNPAELSMWLQADGRFHMNLGAFERSKSYLQQAIQVAERAGDAVALAAAVLPLASVYFFQGDWPTAKRYLEQVVELTNGRNVDIAVWVHVDLAKLAMAEGNYEAAASHVEESIRIAPGIAEPWPGLYARWQLGQLELLQGRPETALVKLAEVRDDPRFGIENLIEVLPALVEVYLELGDLDRADRVAEECVRQAREMNYLLQLPVVLTAQGMVFRRQQRWEDAARVLEEAISLAQQLPYPFAEGRALYEYGTMLATRQTAEGGAVSRDRTLLSPSEALTQALALFQELRSVKYIERTEQALDRLLLRESVAAAKIDHE